MNCFSCTGQWKKTSTENDRRRPVFAAKGSELVAVNDEWSTHIAVKIFKFDELAAATSNFHEDCLLGERDLGRVYKGQINSKQGNYGHQAPEHATTCEVSVQTGLLSVKSDIYSFGVVLVEIITGRKAIGTSKDGEEPSLITWARPLIKDHKFSEMADPVLQGHYPATGLKQAVLVAGTCVQKQPHARPVMAEVVTSLTYIAQGKYDFESQAVYNSD